MEPYTLSFNPHLLRLLQKQFEAQIRPYLHQNPHLLTGGTTHRLRHSDYSIYSYNTYPLLWVACANAKSQGAFQAFFDDIAPALETLFKDVLFTWQRLQLYGGFFVVGHHAESELWHRDYFEDSNALTLLTPLFELDPRHGHLLYGKPDSPQRYVYTQGEAVFVDHKLGHCTEPYASAADPAPLRVLLSLTFGGDDMRYWPAVKPILNSQSAYYLRPCGHSNQQKCFCYWRQQ